MRQPLVTTGKAKVRRYLFIPSSYTNNIHFLKSFTDNLHNLMSNKRLVKMKNLQTDEHNAMYEERLYDLKNINTGKAHKRNYN